MNPRTFWTDLVRLPNGRVPTEARSLEVPEVWETLGGKKLKFDWLQVYCVRENQIWWVDGKWRCARACRARAGKHLTLREKSEISQGHAEIKPSLLIAHPNSFLTCRCDRSAPLTPSHGTLPGLLHPDWWLTPCTLTLLYSFKMPSSSLFGGQLGFPQSIFWPMVENGQMASSLSFGLLIHPRGNNVKERLYAMAVAWHLCPDYWALCRHIHMLLLHLELSTHGEKETCMLQSHLFPRS